MIEETHVKSNDANPNESPNQGSLFDCYLFKEKKDVNSLVMEQFGFYTVDVLSCPTCQQEYKEIFDTHINLIVSPSHKSVQQGANIVFAQNSDDVISNSVKCQCKIHLNVEMDVHRQTYMVQNPKYLVIHLVRFDDTFDHYG